MSDYKFVLFKKKKTIRQVREELREKKVSILKKVYYKSPIYGCHKKDWSSIKIKK